jgi:hypothetical protein
LGGANIVRLERHVLFINYTSHLWLESRRQSVAPTSGKRSAELHTRKSKGGREATQEREKERERERERGGGECKISMNQVHHTQVTQVYIPLQPKAKAPA